MFTYFINSTSATLLNTVNGDRVTFQKESERFEKFLDLIKVGDYESAMKLDTAVTIQEFANSIEDAVFGISIVNGSGTIELHGVKYPLANAIVDKIVSMVDQGFSAEPLYRFLNNLYQNPSKAAIEEFFLFSDACSLPITEDGHVIAYKIVKDDYFDVYSGTIRNKVGDVVEMPRFAVDDDRSKTCSAGLHFCSREYLPHYGTHAASRCMLVKIDPKDIVSIPNDYNNAKGRTCRYEVVGEVSDKDWRSKLSGQDYTTKSVVSSSGNEFDPNIDEFPENNCDHSVFTEYRYSHDTKRWHNLETNAMTSAKFIADKFGISVETLKGLI